MPAECKSMRTSSRRRSRSFMTSTPLAPRSVSTPTRKEPVYNLALPFRPLSPLLYSLAVCLSAVPSQGRWIAPGAPATSDVTGASYDKCGLEGTSYKPLRSQSQTANQTKKKKNNKPCYLS